MKRPQPVRTGPGAKPAEPVVLVSEPAPRRAAGPPVFPEEHRAPDTEESLAEEVEEEPVLEAEGPAKPKRKRCSYCGKLRARDDFYSETMCFSCRAQ